jgi:uncharacterized protein (DUF58 family)
MQRRWLVVWLAVLLALVGITTRSGGLISLSLPILIYLGAGLLLSPGRAKLDIQRFQNTDFEIQGKPVELKLVVSTRGRIYLRYPLRRDFRPGLNCKRAAAASEPYWMQVSRWILITRLTLSAGFTNSKMFRSPPVIRSGSFAVD